MTAKELEQLAAWHEESGVNALKLSNAMLGKAAENFRRKAAMHLDWAEGLRAMVKERNESSATIPRR